MKQIRERWKELDWECFEIEQRLGAVAQRIVNEIFGPVNCNEKR